MKVTASLPTGVAALLFDEARRRRRLETAMVDYLERTGYEEAILPVVDYLEPYDQLLSPASRAELYRFVDRDGALLMLRSDFTPMLARLLAPRLQALTEPLGLFYRGDVLRYQEDRPGRRREFYQLGAEVLGMPGSAGVLEALRRFLALLALSGRKNLSVVLGFAGALDALLREAPNGAALAAALVRRERSAARAAHPVLLEIVEQGEPADATVLGDVTVAHLARLCDQRDQLAAEFPGIALRIDLAEFADQVVDPRLVRGIGSRAYYDGAVFRAYAGDGEPLGGGGRYDRLFEKLGAAIPACGFSFALDRLLGDNPEQQR